MKRVLSLVCALVMVLTATSALAAWTYEDLAFKPNPNTNRWGYELSWDSKDGCREWRRDRYPRPTPIAAPDGSAVYYGWYYYPHGQFVTPGVKPAEPAKKRGGIGDIVWSGEYLKQVWLNNKGLEFRIFADGERVPLKETVSMKDDGSYRLNLAIRAQSSDVKPVLNSTAVDFLRMLDITEVNVKGPMFDQSYSLDELSGLAN